MPRFKYTAKNIRGEVIEGVVDAPKYEDAVSIILKRNYYPVDIRLHKKEVSLSNLKFRAVKLKDLAIFCRQFATTLKAGIPVVDSLNILKHQTENRKLKEVIADLYEVLQKGYSLSASMSVHSDVFPNLLINMVETGEVSGNIDVVMDRMAEHFEKEYRIHQKIKSAMTYPLIVSIVSLVVVTMLIIFVLPTFVGMFEDFGTTLPLATRILISISNVLKRYWYLLFSFVLLISYGANKYLHTKRGRYTWDRTKIRLPVVGKMYTRIVISKFSRTLSTLISSGVDLLKSIEIVAKVIDNSYVVEKMKIVRDSVEKGMGLSQPMMESGIFPPIVYQMVRVGEDTGNLDFALEKTADFYDQEVDTTINQLTTIIEPLMIIILGGIVGFIIASMILPIFDIYSSI